MLGLSGVAGVIVFAVVFLSSTFTGRMAIESAEMDKAWLNQQFRDAQREVVALQAQNSGLLAQEFAREEAAEAITLAGAEEGQ